MARGSVLIAALILASACGPRSHISDRPVPAKANVRAQSCPYRPFGGDSFINLLVVSTTGDTLRDAHLTVRRQLPDSGDHLPPLEANAAETNGWYRLGPLKAIENTVVVTHAGFRSAQYTVSFCRTMDRYLIASLAPE